MLEKKNREGQVLDNLTIQILKFGRNELKVRMLELFNKVADKSNTRRMGKEVIITIHKKGRKVNVKITEELHYWPQPTSYWQT